MNSDEVKRLKLLLKEKDEEIARLKQTLAAVSIKDEETDVGTLDFVRLSATQSLSKDQVERYSRQLILPEVGVEGQKRLASSSVLIIGAGGLGCPAAIYLAAAGIGLLGIVDYDTVDLSNLHRQILHRESAVGTSKARSACRSIQSLNSTVKVTAHCVQINNGNAAELVAGYDLVLDCSDNPATRYLVNDACVLAGKTLVSASALRWEGQLTVYHQGPDGPCYRCLYPKPPNPNFVTNCSDGGVLGVVAGLMGTLQAMEAIKLVLGRGSSFSQRMLVFDGECGAFRVVKLRPKQPDCAVCSAAASIVDLTDVDYTVFCGRAPNDKDPALSVLSADDRVTAGDFARTSGDESVSYLLVDVRPPLETAICSLAGSVNVPFDQLDDDASGRYLRRLVAERRGVDGRATLPVFVVCRRGNNSQLAVLKLRHILKDQDVVIKDIAGGLTAWAEQVDSQFPIY